MREATSHCWHLEYSGRSEAHLRGVARFLVSEKTPYQHVEIFDSYQYGKCLILDGRMQSAEADEYIYHEALVHPAMVTADPVEKAVVIGGGEGATVREILRYACIRRVDMVDIDKRVVDLCRLHLPQWHQGSLDDPRVSIYAEDGRAFIEKAEENYDAVFVDLTEPIEEGPSAFLFTKEFYMNVSEKLSDRGAVAVQSGSSADHDLHGLASIYKTLKEVFPIVRAMVFCVPSFDLPWSICLASKGKDAAALSQREVENVLRRQGVKHLRFYDGVTHEALMRPPRNVRSALSQKGTVLCDERPLIFDAFGQVRIEEKV